MAPGVEGERCQMRTAEAEETAYSGMWASITLSLYQFRNALLCCSIHSVGKTMALLSLRSTSVH